MITKHPHKRLVLRSVVSGAILAVSIAILSGCQFVWPEQFTSCEKITAFVDSLEPDRVGVVVAQANSAEGLGNSVIHEILVFENTDAGARLDALLEDAGFERPTDGASQIDVWRFSSGDGQYTARVLPLEEGKWTKT